VRRTFALFLKKGRSAGSSDFAEIRLVPKGGGERRDRRVSAFRPWSLMEGRKRGTTSLLTFYPEFRQGKKRTGKAAVLKGKKKGLSSLHTLGSHHLKK